MYQFLFLLLNFYAQVRVALSLYNILDLDWNTVIAASILYVLCPNLSQKN